VRWPARSPRSLASSIRSPAPERQILGPSRTSRGPEPRAYQRLGAEVRRGRLDRDGRVDHPRPLLMTQTETPTTCRSRNPEHFCEPVDLRPFVARIVDYGLPGYASRADDLFAITFVLMFGMDVRRCGAGGVLVLGALGLMKLGKIQAVRDAGPPHAAHGFAIAFGITYAVISHPVAPLWHDPVEGDPMGNGRSGIGGGIVLMSIGLVLNMINKFRHRDWLGVSSTKFGHAGAIFYWGILGLCFTWAAVDRAGLAVVRRLVGVLSCRSVPSDQGPLHVYLSRRRGHGEHGSMAKRSSLRSSRRSTRSSCSCRTRSASSDSWPTRWPTRPAGGSGSPSRNMGDSVWATSSGWCVVIVNTS